MKKIYQKATKKMFYFFALSIFFFNSINLFSQIANCNNALPFCGSAALSFPNSTGQTAPSGPNYGTLCTVPYPTWYYMQVGNSGTIQMNINGGSLDVDFAMWGPFNTPAAGCTSIMGGVAPIQSSYNPASSETLGIGAAGGDNSGCTGVGATTPPAAQAGKYYIVLVTNYSNSAGSLSFNQTGGTGSTNCQITQPCDVSNITATASCSGSNAVITGTVTAATGMTTGSLDVTSSCGGSQSFPINGTNFPSNSGVLNYSLSVPGNGQSCTVTAQFSGNQLCNNTITLTVPSCCTIPTPTITTTAASCSAAGTATVSNYAATNTYTFTPPGPTVASPGTISNMTPGTSYTVTAGNGGCTSSASTAFSIQPQGTTPPDPNLNSVAPTCSAAGSTTITNYNASYTYTFNPAGPSVNSSGVITGATYGQAYQLTVSLGGCSSAPVSFTINDKLPQPTVSAGSDVSICSGASTTLTASGASTYSWNNGLGAGATQTVSPVATTTYIVTGTAANGCTNTAQVTVTVSPTVTPTFTNPGPICSGATLTLPTSSTNTPAITGTWSPAANNTATTTYTFTPNTGQCATTTQITVPVNNNVTPTFTNPGPICTGAALTLPTSSTNTPAITGTWSPAADNTTTTTYTFTPSAGQCASVQTMTVTVNNNVTPTFTNPGPICSGATLTLPTTSTNSITGTWSPAPNNTATTTYTFTPNGGGCATSTTMTVVIDNLTAPIFTNPGPICNGTALTLPTTSNNGVSGTWSPSVNNTTTTTYTFTPNSGLCAVTANLTVTVNQKTTPSFTNPGPICQGGTFTLPAVSNDGTPGTWSPVVNNMATTTYTFTPNTGECANTQTLSVVVNPPVTPAFTNPGPICTGDNLILPNASNNGISGTWSPAINNTATTTYTFTPNVGQCANTQTMTVTVGNLNPPVFTIADTICAGINFTLPATSNNGVTGMWSPAFNNTATTTYTFVPDPNQCANTLNKTVYVKAVPTLIVNASSNTICNNDTVKIKVQSMPSGAAIAWTATNNNTTGASNGTGTVVNQTIKLINKTNSGSVTYEFVGALNGCTSAPSYVTYTVNPPMATSTSVTSSVSLVEEGETTNLNVALNPYVPGVLYSWSPSNTLSCSDCPNPIATPDSSRCYYVTVSAPNTCPLTDSVCIKYRIKCGDIFVPTIFSPNGDGSNDVFKVYGRCLAKMQLHIYDRWGEQIFYSDDISEGWDGTYKGKLMNSGTFVYLLHVTTLYNETQELKGNVTLVR